MTRTDITIEITDGPHATRDDDGWEHYAYKLRLNYDGRTMDTPWKQGTGITSDPDASSVIDALASDSASYDNARSFEEWAGEYGYDDDSRKAYALYQQVGEQRDDLAALLGDDYDAIVYADES